MGLMIGGEWGFTFVGSGCHKTLKFSGTRTSYHWWRWLGSQTLGVGFDQNQKDQGLLLS